MKYLYLAALWVQAIGWHLWRILTFRPALARLSDTTFTLASFFTVYLGMGGVRHIDVTGPNHMVLAGLLVQATMLAAVTFSSGFPMRVFTALLGVSAAVDALVVGVRLFSWTVPFPLVLELTLTAVVFWRAWPLKKGIRNVVWKQSGTAKAPDVET